MGSERSLKALERLYLTLFSASAFGSSMASKCNDFNLTNVNNGGGDWQFYSFSGSADCFLCYRRRDRQGSVNYADLALPCMDPNEPSMEKQIQVSYLVRRGGDSEGDQGDMPLSVEQEEVKDEEDELLCQNNSSSTTYLDKGSVKKLNQSLSNLKSGKIQVQGINLTISYRLKIVSGYFRRRRFTLCLTNVELKQQTNLPIWLLLVIISIVILVCLAAVGVVIRQRKLQVHRQRAEADVEKEDAQSRKTKDHSTSVKEDTCHPSFGQDLLNDKDEDDHLYCEIDIKQPTTNNLIYNSAYESASSFR